VAYQNPRDAARAIRELNESLLEGRKIFVQTDSAKSQGRQSSYHIDETRTSSASVYVGNLSFDCNDRSVD
jgi:RNA recognition motif-containing protein